MKYCAILTIIGIVRSERRVETDSSFTESSISRLNFAANMVGGCADGRCACTVCRIHQASSYPDRAPRPNWAALRSACRAWYISPPPQLIYDPVKPLKMKFTLARLCFRPGKLSHAGNFYACLLHHRNIPVLLCLVTVLGIIRRAEQYRIIYIKFFFIHSSHLT